ncbi:hypothetical protein VP01_312g8 [Puccinia sorghi]|uniref:Uncharacterized protein n=1 Tax=Puccinia sorghi TaxID=27349 RepID=A0A0L6UZ96_9BASI|nr:hypothetical protein VP01_312g8 [Puccinia sorghi]
MEIENAPKREKNHCQAVMRYHKFSLGCTSNFNVTSLNVPSVQQGVDLLIQLRIGCLPTVLKRLTALNAQNIPHHLRAGTCPCCHETMDPLFEEWSHITLNCSAMNDIRAKTIGSTILTLMEYLDEEVGVDNENLYVLLQGDSARKYLTMGDQFIEMAMAEFLQQGVPKFKASLYHKGNNPQSSGILCPNRVLNFFPFPTHS